MAEPLPSGSDRRPQRTTLGAVHFPASKALPQLRELLGRLAPAPEVLALLQNVAEEEKENQEKARQREAALLKKEIEELSSKKRSLLELLLKGTVSENEFRTMSNELTLKESAKTGILGQIEAPKQNRFEPEDEFISQLSEALVLGKEAEEEDLRTFLEKTGSNYFLTNGQVVVSLEKRWEIWTEWKSQLPTDFLQSPIGYQLAVVRTLWNAVRMAKNGRC